MSNTHPLQANPKQVPLENAPLVRVIAQLKFSMIASIEKQDFIATFQEAIRDDYPSLRPEQAFSLTMNPVGPQGHISAKIWRFSNEQEKWMVSLSQDFIGIETTAYTSRKDFMRRWERILTAAVECFKLKQYTRLGVRYVDRIQGEALEQMEKFIRPEMLGVLKDFSSSEISHAFSEGLFKLNDSQLLARWGKLNANATFDPTAIEPKPHDTWVLDLDMFSNKPGTLEVEKVLSDSEYYAERIYSFFRWAVTDDFLKYYGGKI